MTDDTKMKHYRRLKVASGFREFRHHIQQDNRDFKNGSHRKIPYGAFTGASADEIFGPIFNRFLILMDGLLPKT